jgi:hypothetical protein
VWAELSVPPSAPFAKDLKAEVRKLGANYIGEVIMLVPKSANPDLLSRLVRDLQDVESHVGIPYWSKRYEKYFDLFDRVKILERSGTAERGSLTAEEHMSPFDDYRARYEWKLEGGRLSFFSTNETHLSYDGRKAVSPGQMIWRLEAYENGDAGCCTAKARSKPSTWLGLLLDRLSASFMGRIEASSGIWTRTLLNHRINRCNKMKKDDKI